jgi:hypothetical protein
MSFLEDINVAIQSYKDSRAQRKHGTRLKVHTTTDTTYLPLFSQIMSLARGSDEIPTRNTYEYVLWLDELWKKEPILAGAVYSMAAKMQSMTWKVEGGRNNAGYIARMLARFRHLSGEGWIGAIGSSAIDFYSQNGGVWWDVAREGSSQWGRISDLATIDTRCCILTGNASVPMYYRSSITDDEHWYKPGEFIHFVSMPLPEERGLGIGFCAVARAARAAKLLMALHDYDAEKLSNLPPEGIATVTG